MDRIKEIKKDLNKGLPRFVLDIELEYLHIGPCSRVKSQGGNDNIKTYSVF